PCRCLRGVVGVSAVPTCSQPWRWSCPRTIELDGTAPVDADNAATGDPGPRLADKVTVVQWPQRGGRGFRLWTNPVIPLAHGAIFHHLRGQYSGVRSGTRLNSRSDNPVHAA